MKERLIEFLKYLRISQDKFEKNVGLSRGFVNKVGDSIREKNLGKIQIKYPELNTNWLKTGHGEMINSNKGEMNINGSSDTNFNINDISASLKNISEASKIHAEAAKINADANKINAIANDRNSKNIEDMLKMIQNKIDPDMIKKEIRQPSEST